jgi:zinc transport system substrate-binding protein
MTAPHERQHGTQRLSPSRRPFGRSLRLLAAALGTLLAATQVSCVHESVGEQDSGDARAPQIEAFAGIPPLACLAQRIGGSHVHVRVLVEPGQDPHIFQPSPRQVLALSKAKLLFKSGMPFESRLVEKVTQHNPHLIVVDATEGIHERPMTEEEDDDHQHAGAPDPHVWLAPPLLKVMAGNVAAALARADPAHAGAYQENLAGVTAELDALHARIARVLAPYRGQSFYVFHPAFGYFGDTYGLKQEAVENEGRPPTPRQLRALIHKARSENVKIIFLQPRFDARSAQAVADVLGGAVVPLDPLAWDVVKNLQDVAGKIEQALKPDL